jgi:hypothetical protein
MDSMDEPMLWESVFSVTSVRSVAGSFAQAFYRRGFL